MNRRAALQATAACSVSLAWGLHAGEVKKSARLGVSLAGPEFGNERPGFSNLQPGKAGVDYTYNTEKTTEYFCGQRLRTLRMPLRWERLQPRLGQPLHPPELARVKLAIAWAKNHQGQVIIDIHNYGRYFTPVGDKLLACVIDQEVDGKVPVTRTHFADLWARLSAEFRDDPTVWAYGLMNEPHDLGASDWKAISQAAVAALRRNKDCKVILVAGNDWSNAQRFVESNGPKAWIDDADKNTAYEAHCYFDKDHTGQYKLSYEQERQADPKFEERGLRRLQPFLDWCKRNQVPGFLGEFGVPPDPAWAKVLTPFLEALAAADMPACWWAAGEWWRDYPLSIQPRDDFRQPAPQLLLLEKFTGKS